MKLCIDAGHGFSNRKAGVYDPGAVASTKEGLVCEADVALKYALTLKELCVREGVKCFLTRTSSADNCPVATRAKRAQDAGCTHFISLHLNASTSGATFGMETLYSSEKDRLLALRLQQNIVTVTKFRDRGIKERDDLAVLKFRPGPAVLIEFGFISNKGDREYLMNRDNRIAICEEILRTVRG